MTEAPIHRRVKLLKTAMYAREALEPGAVVVVDAGTALTWIKAKIAVETDAAMPLWTSCPRCGSSFPIAETPEAAERWVSCGNGAGCGFGWLR